MFDDYNDDGNPDFTLGQYGTSNHNCYLIFSINHEGIVEKLDTGGKIIVDKHAYSVQLKKNGDKSFIEKYYCNSGPVPYVKKVYKWEKKKFVVTQ